MVLYGHGDGMGTDNLELAHYDKYSPVQVDIDNDWIRLREESI